MHPHHSICRRRAFTAILAGASAIATARPAFGASDDDRAEWLALWRAFLAAEASYKEARAAHDSEAIEATGEAMDAAADAIKQHPVTGMLGVAVQLALWAHTDLADAIYCAGGADTEEGQFWLTDPAVAAWHNACRLAGLPHDMGLEMEAVS